MINEVQENNNQKSIYLNQSYLDSQQQLDHCSNLKIYFNFNKSLIDESILQFYSSISHISQLEIEIASFCRSEDENILNLFQGLATLTQLSSLSIVVKNQELSASCCKLLGKLLEIQKQLRVLKLIFKQHNVSSKGEFYIMNGLQDMLCLIDLQSFHLEIGQDNQVGDHFIKIFADSLKKMKSLNSLYLLINKNNEIKQVGARYLSEGLKSLTKLNTLFLHIYENNNIGRDGWKYLAGTFQTFANLNHLNLFISDPNFGQVEAKSFFKGLSYLKKIIEINFEYQSKSRISHQIFQELKTSLQTLKKLSQLSITVVDQKSCTKESHQSFGQCFQGLTWVDNMQLSINKNTVSNINSINYFMDSIGAIKNLTRLSLIIKEEVKFGIQGIKSISEGIKNYKNLRQLTLAIQTNRKLPEKGYQFLFESLGILSTLTQLSIDIGDLTLDEYESLQFLAKATKKLNELTDYQVKVGENNQIGNQGFDYLCESFKNIVNLNQLSFEISSFNEVNTIVSYGRLLESKPQLLNLFFKIGKKNIVNFESITSIGQGLKSLNNLQELSIEIQQFDESNKSFDLAPLLEGIRSLVRLTSLSITFGSEYKIEPQAACQIVSTIPKLKTLKKLILNVFSNESYKIYQQIEIVNNLQDLDQLEQIEIRSQGEVEIVSQFEVKRDQFLSFQCRERIFSLNLYNSITVAEEDMSILSKKFENIKEMTYLDIHLISQTIIAKNQFYILSNSFRNFLKLTTLIINVEDKAMFGDNDISELAVGLGYLENLTVLNIVAFIERGVNLENSETMRNSLSKLIKLKKLQVKFNRYEGDLEIYLQIMKAVVSLPKITHLLLQQGGINEEFMIEKKPLKDYLREDEVRKEKDEMGIVDEDNEKMIDENSQQQAFYTIFNANISKRSTFQGKIVSDIGKILQLSYQYHQISLSFQQDFEFEKESLLQLSQGLKNQSTVEKLKFTSSENCKINKDYFLGICLSLLQSKNMKQIDLVLRGEESVEALDLFQINHQISQMKPLSRMNITLEGPFRMSYSQNSSSSQIKFQQESKRESIQKPKFNQIQKLTLNLSDCLISPMNNSMEIHYPKLINLKILKLQLLNFEMNTNAQDLLFKWVGNLKLLEKCNFFMFQKEEIKSLSLEQLSYDLSQIESLISLDLTIDFNDKNIEPKTYFSFIKSFKGKSLSLNIQLGRNNGLKTSYKNEYGYSNIILKVGQRVYYLTASRQTNEQIFVSSMYEYLEDINHICFNFDLNPYHNFKSTAHIYSELMKKLNQENLRINHLGVQLKSNEYFQEHEGTFLFQNCLSQSANVDELNIQLKSYYYLINFKYLQHVTNLTLNTDIQLDFIRNIIISQMKRLVTFKFANLKSIHLI